MSGVRKWSDQISEKVIKKVKLKNRESGKKEWSEKVKGENKRKTGVRKQRQKVW